MRRFPVAAAVLSVLFAAPAWAQTAIQPGTIVGTFQASQYYQASSSTLLNVPADRNARVTDIHITNYNSTTCNALMGFGSTIYAYTAPPNATLVIPLVSGFGVAANGFVTLGGTSCATSSSVLVTVRGFYFTIP